MDRVELGRGGPKVSAIGLGMWQAGGGVWGSDFNDEDCVRAMVRAHELGINLIDTAEGYGDGHSEEIVGRAIKEIGREELVVATKVGGNHLRYDDVLRACDGSLRRLGIRTIDVYQIHWPDSGGQVPLKQTMGAMEELHRRGKIGALGVCNFAVRDLEEARSHLGSADIVSDQVSYSLLHREVEQEVLPYCRREGIAILPWSPLAKGLLTGKYDASHRPADHLRADAPLFSPGNLQQVESLVKVLREAGSRHGKSPAQVALNWLIRHPAVVPIPGAKRPQQAEENAGAAGWRLGQGEVDRIEAALGAMKLDRF